MVVCEIPNQSKAFFHFGQINYLDTVGTIHLGNAYANEIIWNASEPRILKIQFLLLLKCAGRFKLYHLI
jgi:hypothetical protein